VSSRAQLAPPAVGKTGRGIANGIERGREWGLVPLSMGALPAFVREVHSER
jgi:hypothetical protein